MPAGTSGLPSGSVTASTANNSIVANPSLTTAYTVTTTNPNTGCVSTSTINVNVNTSNIWAGGTTNSSWFTASNWSCGSVPTAASDVIIPNVSPNPQPIVNDSSKIALANTLTVQSNSSLTVDSGNTLKVTDKLTNNGGTITFEDSASLVQTNPAAVNFGNILYKRTTSTLSNNYDFVYWSSPVAAQQIGTIWMASNWADTFYNYNPGTPGWARSYATTPMIAGKGYIARARNGQQGWDYNNNVSTFTVGGTWNANFFGVPNNGTITVTDCVAGEYCLLGNPYPSAIDAFKFLDLPENKAVLEGTLYFWTHNTKITDNAYTSDDYASYNGTGSIATSGGSKSPSGKIAAGQGFFAKATAACFNANRKIASPISFNILSSKLLKAIALMSSPISNLNTLFKLSFKTALL